MTLEESEKVVFLNREIKHMQSLPDRISKLHKEGKHDEVANIAFELSSIVQGHLETELSKYPPKAP